MRLTNLNPSKYKRFFAFGCSFTNYAWPTWADIIGQDIPIYQNWGKRGGGNHFIFNSIMEAHARHQFNKDDLVIVAWSTKEREDRYYNNSWLNDTNTSQEKTYGKKWFETFGLDFKGYLIRDLALIKSAQVFLESCECDWENFTLNPMTNIDHGRVKEAGVDIKKIPEKEKYEYWVKVFDQLCDGKGVDPYIQHRDVIEIYKDVFLKINKSIEGRWSYEHKTTRVVPNNDVHPTPIEALSFLDEVWPENSLSDKARDYAKFWNEEIYKHKEFLKPIHPVTAVVRL